MLILSASLETGAFEAEASSTRAIIWERVVSSPTLSALKVKVPDKFMEALTTLSPAAFSTGRLSPVIAASSTEEFPSTIIPSTGMEKPGLIKIKSPFTISSTGISSSLPFLITRAVLGLRFISFVIA